MAEILKHAALHVLEDSWTLFLFLIVTYIILGIIDNVSEEKSRKLISDSGKWSPLLGGLLGAFPQCGFSAAASNFYAAGIIGPGTLLAVFMSTSDEMLPVFIAREVSGETIIKIIGAKIAIGVITGYLIALIFQEVSRRKKIIKHDHYCSHHGQIKKKEEKTCEHFHHKHKGKCTAGEIIKHGILHGAETTIFIMIISFVLNIVLLTAGDSLKAAGTPHITAISILLSALVGLIPNCASSVAISEFYIEGVIGAGAMISGLLVSAGVGIIVLFKENRNQKENLLLIAMLYGFSVLWGFLIEGLGIVF